MVFAFGFSIWMARKTKGKKLLLSAGITDLEPLVVSSSFHF